MKRNKLICLILIYIFIVTSLVKPAPAQIENSKDEPEKTGLQFRLREVRESKPEARNNDNPPAEKLGAAEADAILRRLPPLAEEPADRAEFSLRENSLPPPKTGRVVPVEFPAGDSPNPPAASAGILEVLRATPEGATPLAKDLSVTFSQPMVAVTTRTKAAENVPVKLAPEVAGEWRWLGTKTLIFAAKDRFPMATRFTATVPAGTRSANGRALAKDFSWTFETPPPKVLSFLPQGDSVRPDAVWLASFDQKIDAAAVLPKIGAVAEGKPLALRPATPAEIERDWKSSDELKKTPADRRIFLRPVEPPPLGTRIDVVFDAGLPSAEGPLTSVAAQKFSFSIYAPLRFEKAHCGWDEKRRECAPYEDFRLTFNNPLDAENFDKSLVAIEPPIADAEISVNGGTIDISGGRKPRTRYRISVSGALRDRFGQSLGRTATAELVTAKAESSIYSDAENKEFLTLDPFAKPVFAVYTTNYSGLKVKLFAVTPADYAAYYDFTRKRAAPAPNIGRLVYDQTLKLKVKPDAQLETSIDLKRALPSGTGHAILIVEPLGGDGDKDRRIVVWIQATRIGLDAFADAGELLVYASDLKTGKPLNDVSLKMADETGAATGADGLARLPLDSKNDRRWLVGRSVGDSVILNGGTDDEDRISWAPSKTPESLRWFVFDDRQIYRPGETVSVKGYLRRFAGGKLGDVEELGDAVRNVNYVLKDPFGREVSRGTVTPNLFGAFDLQLKIPETVNLGYQTLAFETASRLGNADFAHRFRVEEFRRPEFEVTATTDSAAPFFVGGSATIGVEAKYYAGGGLAGARARWNVKATPANYTPPGRDDFTFGKFAPWWRDDGDSDYARTTSDSFVGTTGPDGRQRLAIDFDKAGVARPFSVTAEARVEDVNRQAFASTTTLLVHPSEVYVGLRTPKNFVEKGEKYRVETIATDIDGSAVEGAPEKIVAELKDWQQVKGEWKEVTIDRQSCALTSTKTVGGCEFTATAGGRVTVTAEVLDRRERRNESELDVWVAGGTREPARDIERETVELIPDKQEYAPGETAEILVNAPFFPAEGVLTLRRGGIVKTERFSMTDASTVLKIPVEEAYLPNFHAQVDLFGATKRVYFESELDAKLPPRPAYAGGELNLPVSVASRRLTVVAEPREATLEPGGATTIDVAVADAAGRHSPDAEVAVVAVDESVLALTNYRVADPLDAFYPQLEANVNDFYSRESVVLAEPENLLSTVEKFSAIEKTMMNGYGMGNGSGGLSENKLSFGLYDVGQKNTGAYNPSPRDPFSVPSWQNGEQSIRLRTNFNALAIFSPSVRTDAAGRATVQINLPDNLTRYRITAVAATRAKQFGKTESAITARQPLMVRPSPPRFLNFGDRAEIPVVVQNQTNQPLTVDVALRATTARLADGDGRRVTVAANDRAELRFPVTAETAGVARFQVGATSGTLADAAEFAFPVYTPATTEAFAVYGTTAENGAFAQPVSAPADVFPQYGGLEVTTSSTQLQELTDAFIYLQNYPFECSEQVSSRILSVAALRDVLQAFDAKGLPPKERIDERMKADIERLQKLQHGDGGFSFWSAKDESLPYLTVHVAHALARARSKGYAVPPALTSGLLKYLGSIESKYSPFDDGETRRAVSAYALYVRALLGDRDAEKARRLFKETDAGREPAETLGWLLAVLAGGRESAEIKRVLLNRVTETAGAAHFATGYRDPYVLLDSDRRADAVVLDALITTDPNGDLIPKLVRGLLGGRAAGRWRNTQDNAFVLLALDRYFQTYEKETPDFTARAWLGKMFAGEQKFAGRSVDSKRIDVPMRLLQQEKSLTDLILEKQGAGRLYYRIGLKYAPQNLDQEAADAGFAVTRAYEPLDDPADVRQNDDGSWAIRAGARVRVRVRMVATAQRYHVALVDYLPAGFEILNSSLAVTESLPPDEKQASYYRTDWFEHQNLRDERAEAFKSVLGAGIYDYSFVARATTPGIFVAPPARAEEMYAPETFGRSRTDFVTVF
ncbi:MAG: Ig-like domain-containing protein [Acidobacteria bacterium]|nr:Ig-like domain-containing protein [Acidobacteriota bacterium]